MQVNFFVRRKMDLQFYIFKKGWVVAPVVQFLHRKYKAQISNPSITEKIKITELMSLAHICNPSYLED
jgi:hypothetical protein